MARATVRISLRFMTRRTVAPLVRLAGAWVLASLLSVGCGGLTKQYEYEEDLYPALDGSATLYLNASVPALVALRGLDLDVDAHARLDRRHLRALFSAPGLRVALPTLSRRHGRRFVHLRIDADDVRVLTTAPPLGWSAYRFDRDQDVFDFRQSIGAPSGKNVGNVGWTGEERIAFRLHVPSRIEDQNSDAPTERGNILTWEQRLQERLNAAPLDLHVRMETESILSRTLLLFGATIVAAALTFVAVIWWLARRGRDAEVAESRS
jgi:hypothetical protein